MRKNIITGVSLVALSAGMAQAGGIELQTLDTSIMYADGNQIAVSTANINPSIEGVNPAAALANINSKRKVVKDQTVTNLAGKFDYGENLSFGIATFRSGAVQLDGGNGVSGNLAPTGDVNMDTTAFMVNYRFNENLSIIGGLTNNVLKNGNVTTMAGAYQIDGATEQGYLVGAAYSIPEIALRAEFIYQPKTTVNTSASFTGSGSFAPASNPNAASSLSLPDAYAVSFQTGIAADTLLTASYRKANWSKAQVNSSVVDAATLTAFPDLEAANINTEFDDTESYSIGIGRKFTDYLSGSITYSSEPGTGSTSKSLFSVSNGSEAISIGLQYKRDNMTISAGVSKRNVGDITVDPEYVQGHPLHGQTMKYTGNTVTAMGVKIAFAF